MQQIQNFVNRYGRDFQEIRVTTGWNRNTYDQQPYPSRGSNQQLSGIMALPAVNQSFAYYKASYAMHWYQPLFSGFILSALGNIGYGNQFNGTGLPFFENYYAGGIALPGQVRGYQSYSLGPQDQYGNSLGANMIANGTLGLVLPYPVSQDTVRTTAFIDFGNVFSSGLPQELRGTDAGPMRASGGISVEWRSPFGPLAFSVAAPMNKQPLDQSQYFQFSMSSGF